MTLVRSWDFWAGAVLTLGTGLFAPAMTYGLFVLQANRRFTLVKPALLLALVIGASSLYVTDWIAPIEWGFRIILLASLFRHFRINKSFVAGSGIVLLVQLGFVGWQIMAGEHRPYGISPNASSLGLGMFGAAQVHPILGFLAAITLGLSGSRTYLLALGILAVMQLDRLKVGYVLLAGLVALGFAFETGMMNRFGFDPQSQAVSTEAVTGSIKQRVKEYTPANIEPLGEVGEPESVERSLWEHLRAKPFGFGYREYNHATGRVNPHNQFLLMLWELGLLSLPFAGVLVWWVWRSGFDWSVWFALAPALILTDEYYARPEAMFSLALLLIGVKHYVDVWVRR